MENRKIIWFDSTVSDKVPGKLLSDNIGYFGDCLLTGMTYNYSVLPSGIGDTAEDYPEMIMKRLTDGMYEQKLTAFGRPAEFSEGYAEVVFDLKRRCFISEIDLSCLPFDVLVTLSYSVDGENYSNENTFEFKDFGSMLHRIEESLCDSARYIKLKIKAESAIELWQVWIWGDADPEYPADEVFEQLTKCTVANSVAIESIPGIQQTAYTDVEGFRWSKKLHNDLSDCPECVWSELDAYGSINGAPIMPDANAVNRDVNTVLFSNSVSSVCLALTNTNTCEKLDVTVAVDAPEEIKIKLSVFGAIASRWYGVNLGPIFDKESRISNSHMRKYLSNSEDICDFPDIHLTPGGSSVFWLKIESNSAKPGKYPIVVSAGDSKITVFAEILDIELPEVKTGCQLWGNSTTMAPFIFEDRLEKEIDYRIECGINFYSGLPEPGTPAAKALEMDPRSQYLVWGVGVYGHYIYMNRYEGNTPEVRKFMEENLASIIEHAKELGIGVDRFIIESADEPGEHNMESFAAMMKLIREMHPELRLFANPAFWRGFENDAVADDETIYRCLKDWYDIIDVSAPLMLNLDDRPKSLELFTDKNREYNGQYAVSAQHMKSDRPELVNLARSCVWDSIANGMNFWGFFSYFRPENDCWNDFDRMQVLGFPDYQCVYAGVNGPVPTRASEALREGYTDYRIMELLKTKDPALHSQFIDEYKNGVLDFKVMRSKAIESLKA